MLILYLPVVRAGFHFRGIVLVRSYFVLVMAVTVIVVK